ncbi:MAG: DNA cytosine methyltransferase [Candidatus Parvarchaeota archaeon]|nr:DNA cytosine methyltransferase [Candidatus Parvarchaeota archaeon]
MEPNKINAISLFSGAGGLDCGIEMSQKINIMLANDIKKPPAETYSKNFKSKIVDVREAKDVKDVRTVALGDVTDIKFDKLNIANVELIVGGPPCQDFSMVRGPESVRQGINVARGKLYAQFVRALYDIQPKFFLFENVPGLKSANKHLAYETIVKDFSELNKRWTDIEKIAGDGTKREVRGYDLLFSDIVDATRFGVPQKRKRLLILGVKKGIFSQAQIEIFTKTAAEDLSSKSLLLKYPLTPIEAFEGQPLDKLQDKYKNVMKAYSDIAEQPKTKRAIAWKEKVWEKLKFDIVEDYKLINNIADFNESEFATALKEHERILSFLGYLGKSLNETDFDDDSNKIPVDAETVMKRLRITAPGENYEFVTDSGLKGHGMSLIYRRIHPLKPSNTIVAFGGGGTWGYHYERNRGKLTNRERARLQSFPDSFIFAGKLSEVRAQIGEAVPPLLGYNVAELFMSLK